MLGTSPMNLSDLILSSSLSQKFGSFWLWPRKSNSFRIALVTVFVTKSSPESALGLRIKPKNRIYFLKLDNWKVRAHAENLQSDASKRHHLIFLGPGSQVWQLSDETYLERTKPILCVRDGFGEGLIFCPESQ